MDMYQLNSPLKLYSEQSVAEYPEPSTDVQDLSPLKPYTSNNSLLSSSAWSAVIHQPMQDSDPEDLPSTVDMEAIKEPPTPMGTAAQTPSQLNDDSQPCNLIDEATGESGTDSDSGSRSGGNTDTDNEQGDRSAASSSSSDSESVSSQKSNTLKTKIIESHSSRSNSPAPTARQQFSVRETNLDQGGVKLKLSALKVSKRSRSLAKRRQDYSSGDEDADSSDSSDTDVKWKKRSFADYKLDRKYGRTLKPTEDQGIQMWKKKKRNDKNYCPNRLLPVSKFVSKDKTAKSSVSSRTERYSALHKANSRLKIDEKTDSSSDETHKTKVSCFWNKSGSGVKSVTSDACVPRSQQARRPVYPPFELPQSCNLSEDSESDSEKKDSNLNKGGETKNEKNQNRGVMQKLTQQLEPGSNLPVSDQLQVIDQEDLTAILSDAESANGGTGDFDNLESLTSGLPKQSNVLKNKVLSSDSNSDTELLPEQEQIVQNAINSIEIDSDNSDYDDKKKSEHPMTSDSRKPDHRSTKYSGLLESFTEKTDSKLPSSSNRGESCSRSMSASGENNPAKKNVTVVRNGENRSRSRSKIRSSSLIESESCVRFDSVLSNVSPDSGIQSNSGSPIPNPVNLTRNRSRSCHRFDNSDKSLLSRTKKEDSSSKNNYFENRSIQKSTIVDLKKHNTIDGSSKSHVSGTRSRRNNVTKQPSDSLVQKFSDHKNRKFGSDNDVIKVPPFGISKKKCNQDRDSMFSTTSEEKQSTRLKSTKHPFLLEAKNSFKMGSYTSSFYKAPWSTLYNKVSFQNSFRNYDFSAMYKMPWKKKGNSPKMLPVFRSLPYEHMRWSHKHKKWKRKHTKSKSVSREFSAELEHLMRLLEKCTVNDNPKISESSRAKTGKSSRKRRCTEEVNSTADNFLSTVTSSTSAKRKQKKNADLQKASERVDQSLPLKKRHYHIASHTSHSELKARNEDSQNKVFLSVAPYNSVCLKTKLASKCNDHSKSSASYTTETIRHRETGFKSAQNSQAKNAHVFLKKADGVKEKVGSSKKKSPDESQKKKEPTPLKNDAETLKRGRTSSRSCARQSPKRSPPRLRARSKSRVRNNSTNAENDAKKGPKVETVTSHSCPENSQKNSTVHSESDKVARRDDTSSTTQKKKGQTRESSISKTTKSKNEVTTEANDTSSTEILSKKRSKVLEKPGTPSEALPGVFEPSQTLLALSKTKKTGTRNIAEVLSKLTEKLKGVESTQASRFLEEMGDITSESSRSSEPTPERSIRTKRTPEEQEERKGKKIKLDDKTSIVDVLDTPGMLGVPESGGEKKKMKRRKVINRTGFPVKKKKKKFHVSLCLDTQSENALNICGAESTLPSDDESSELQKVSESTPSLESSADITGSSPESPSSGGEQINEKIKEENCILDKKHPHVDDTESVTKRIDSPEKRIESCNEVEQNVTSKIDVISKSDIKKRANDTELELKPVDSLKKGIESYKKEKRIKQGDVSKKENFVSKSENKKCTTNDTDSVEKRFESRKERIESRSGEKEQSSKVENVISKRDSKKCVDTEVETKRVVSSKKLVESPKKEKIKQDKKSTVLKSDDKKCIPTGGTEPTVKRIESKDKRIESREKNKVKQTVVNVETNKVSENTTPLRHSARILLKKQVKDEEKNSEGKKTKAESKKGPKKNKDSTHDVKRSVRADVGEEESDNDTVKEQKNQRKMQQKWKRRFLPAGLFSDFYKEERSSVIEQKNRMQFKSEDHSYGLLPPPYCDDWVRQRQVDFKLPYDLWWLHKRNQLPGRDAVASWNYKKIRTNVYYDIKPSYTYEAQACNCKVPAEKEEKGCGDDCINRVVFSECSPQLCPLKDRCSNQRIQKHEWSSGLAKFMTKEKGWGVKATEPIKKGEFILEYVGEVVSESEFKDRMNSLYQKDIYHYGLNLDGGLVIDGHRMGGYGRFVNHSCEPNCEMQKWSVNGLYRMVLFALRDIKPGEELSYDYNFALYNPSEGQPCKCGSSRCRGVIGGKYQRINSISDSYSTSGQENTCNNSTAVSPGSCVSSNPSAPIKDGKLQQRARPRKSSRKTSHHFDSQPQALLKNVRRHSSVSSSSSSNSAQYRNGSWLVPVKPLTPQQKEIVVQFRIFLLRNLNKIQNIREKYKQVLANKEATNNESQNKPKQESNNVKHTDAFITQLNALSTQRLIRTRQLAQAQDDPEVTRIARLANAFRNIYSDVVNAKDEKDEPLSAPFMTLPSKRKVPMYYQRISEPIDLVTIEHNIITGGYKTVDTFDKDMNRLFANSVKYYGRTSDNGIAAIRLRKEYNIAKLKYASQLEEIVEQALPPNFIPEHEDPGDEEEDVIRCICGMYNDEGLMIQCERCLVWQHCDCVHADTNAEHYLCERCNPREVDYEIPLDMLPDYAKPGEKHFLTLMRDKLQIRQGDTVYVLRDIPNPETGERHTFHTMKDFRVEDCDIFRVERLWKNEKGERLSFGHHYLRPHETFHEPTRKFFPNELVKVPLYEAVPLELIMGQCYVLDLNTFCKGKPMNADPQHIYICELRVDKAARLFYRMPKPKHYQICTKSYAFERYDVRLKPTRTYAPHGEMKQTSTTLEKKDKQQSHPPVLNNLKDQRAPRGRPKCDAVPDMKNMERSRASRTADRSINSSRSSSKGPRSKKDDTSASTSVADPDEAQNENLPLSTLREKMALAKIEKQKQRLNGILLRLLSKGSHKTTLDASYLLDLGRRNRKKPAHLNT